MKHDVLKNRAEAETMNRICCDRCFEQAVFLLRDKDHEFTMGLSEILKCLRFAEKEGEVPTLPAQWWNDIECRFGIEVE